MRLKIGLGIVLVFAVLQLFTIEKIPFEQATENDFVVVEQPNEELTVLLKTICYDCHSNQVNYPWYSNLAPVSWWLQDHIDHGRKHLNFSTWNQYPSDKKAHKAEEVWEEVEKKEMPLESYTFVHRDADLTDEQISLIVAYFKKVERKYSE